MTSLLVVVLLSLRGQDPAPPRRDLGPGERLEGSAFIGRKEVRFPSEADARAYLGSISEKAELRQDGDRWRVDVPVSVHLERDILGRFLDKRERLIDGVLHRPTGRLFTTRPEAEAFAKANAKVEGVREEIVDGRTLHSAHWTDRSDLVAQARERLREEGLAEPWIVRPLPGGWKTDKSRFGSQDPTVHGASSFVQSELRSATREDVTANVDLYASDPLVEHQLLGRLLAGKWSLRRTSKGTLIELRDATGWFLGWKHREGVFIVLSGFDPEAPDLLEAYLRRFPSAWGDDFAVDAKAWRRTEVEFRLRRMGELLDAKDDGDGGMLPYNSEFLEIGRWYDVPLLWNLKKARTPEQLREHLRKLGAWWTESGRDAAPRERAPVSRNRVFGLSSERE